MIIIVWKTDGTMKKFNWAQVSVKENWGTIEIAESPWDTIDIEEDGDKIVKIEVIP